MGKLQEFINGVSSHLSQKDGSYYCWGGQGQQNLTDAQIKAKETSAANAKRVIDFKNQMLAKGFKNLRAFDCSGLGMYYLQNIMKISSIDLSSASMYSKLCTPITKLQLKKGDMVFRKDGIIYHVGYVVDEQLNVVEAKGRDDGVVKRSLNASGTSYWNCFGRPDCFKAEIEAGSTTTETEKDRTKQMQTALNSAYKSGLAVDGIIGKHTEAAINKNLLKSKSPRMKGAYVKWVQSRLKALGYNIGSSGADSVYGDDTKTAVKQFQKAKGLGVDGVVGVKTIKALVK